MASCALAGRIADAEDLEAVTMRRIAGELGIAVMSLYNYLPAKEQLAQLMTDHVAAEYAYPGTPVVDPRCDRRSGQAGPRHCAAASVAGRAVFSVYSVSA
jgi:AcrR family transcriptional regulator